MTAIPGPNWQPYVPVDYAASQLPTRDPITKYLYKIGQVGPATERRWNMQHGRYLAGLGSNETQPAYAAKQDSYARKLEKDDDVYGSGIFDAYGREATVNTELGVFADHPSLPGYIDREVQFSVSQDISDITTGADVVIVPGGGMTYQEKDGYPAAFDKYGPTPCPPRIAFSPASGRMDVYATLSPQAAIPTTFAPGPSFTPGPMAPQAPANLVPAPSSTPTPMLPAYSPAYNVLVPAGASYPVGKAYNPQLIPSAVQSTRLGSKDTSRIADLITRTPGPLAPTPSLYAPGPNSSPRFVRGIGADPAPEPAGWGTFLFGGLLVGTAAAMVYGAMNIKATPNRRRRIHRRRRAA